jgi:predicted RNA binding protein YcfA (HicA-like mRNA interferase family)
MVKPFSFENMNKLPQISGIKVLKILCNRFNFKLIKSRGSHRTLINDKVRPPVLLEIVISDPIRVGTLSEVISKANIGREAFLDAVNS